MANKDVLIEARELTKYFDVGEKKKLHAVDKVSFEIRKGETLGLVGESGCGKSTVGNVVMRLLKPTGGALYFDGENIFDMPRAKKKELCKKMQIVFQDPYSSLNPKKVIRSILEEPFRIHKLAHGKELEKKVNALIAKTGLEPYLLEKFPHEIDGGKRQLVGITRALALEPEFIVCDEPVSALDVSVQATIINLLMDLQKEMGLSYLFISHDLSVVRHISNRIAVMYLGQIVEIANTDEIFENTLHPYSIALLSAVPTVEQTKNHRIVLKGDVPSPVDPKPGCRFAPRCWMAKDICYQQSPELRDVGCEHCVACHFYQESRERAKAMVDGDDQ